MDNRTYYLLLGLILGFGAGVAVTVGVQRFRTPGVATAQGPASSGQIAGLPAPIEIDIAGRPSFGRPDAPITIVEFTDFECPYCRRHLEVTFPQLIDRWGDSIRYVVRHMPITSIHPRAFKAAEASECAHDQDRFFEYHEVLFRNQRSLGIDELKQYARELGLDSARFNNCLDSGAKVETVRRDLRTAISLGIRGTPAFYVNGYGIPGAQPLEVFEAYIQALLALN